jgi:Flp pilus assembly protein TadD
MTAYRNLIAVGLVAIALSACVTAGEAPATAVDGTLPALPALAVAPIVSVPEPTPLQPAPIAAVESLLEAKRQFRDGNYGLAEQAFRATIEAQSTNGEAWLGLAATYDQLQRFDLADRAYDRATQILGARPELLNNRGYSYLMRGDRRKAMEYFERARSIDPRNEVVEANLGLVAATPPARRVR